MKVRNGGEEVYSFIGNINQQLESLIRSTLEFNELDDSHEINFQLLEKSPYKVVKCWEIMQCKRLGCPSFQDGDYRCWLKAGTLCGGFPQGDFAQKYNSCYSCKVFNQYRDDIIQALYENIGIIVKHLGDRAKQAKEQAIKDNLTGLYNRNYLDIIIDRELKMADRNTSPISIIIFDIDNLKFANDNFGHIVGDKMLHYFGLFLKTYTRGSDILFRMGGDEFLMFMNDTNQQQCSIVSKRLLFSIKEWNESIKKSLPVPISFSLGEATGLGLIDFNSLVAKADKRMYVNKNTQRTL